MGLINAGCQARFSGVEGIFSSPGALQPGAALCSLLQRNTETWSDREGHADGGEREWVLSAEGREQRAAVDRMLLKQLDFFERWPRLSQYMKTMTLREWLSLGATSGQHEA